MKVGLVDCGRHGEEVGSGGEVLERRLEEVERMVEEMERCRRSMREVEEMVRGWHLERRKESQVEREKAGTDGDRRCGTAERKRAEGRKEKEEQRTWKDGNVRVEMKEGKKQKKARRGWCIWDSKEADRKRDIEESEEVGVVGKGGRSCWWRRTR